MNTSEINIANGKVCLASTSKTTILNTGRQRCNVLSKYVCFILGTCKEETNFCFVIIFMCKQREGGGGGESKREREREKQTQRGYTERLKE